MQVCSLKLVLVLKALKQMAKLVLMRAINLCFNRLDFFLKVLATVAALCW